MRHLKKHDFEATLGKCTQGQSRFRGWPNSQRKNLFLKEKLPSGEGANEKKKKEHQQKRTFPGKLTIKLEKLLNPTGRGRSV